MAWVVEPSSASVAIATTRYADAQFAPEAIAFEATPSNFGATSPAGAASWWDPAMHEIEYAWDFGDPDSTFDVTENLPPEWTDANTARGQCAAHVYSAPGTYTVTCTARRIVSVDPITIREATATTTVTVADQEDYFGPTTQVSDGSDQDMTIVVALDGDFTDAPAGEQKTAEDGDTLESWQRTARGILEWIGNGNIVETDRAGYVRILFKRGETYASNLGDDRLQRMTNAEMKCVLFSHWGDPADPPPKFVRFGQGQDNEFGNRTPAYIFDGIDFEGDYDPVTQTAGPDTLTAMNFNDGSYKLITNCRISKHSAGVHYAPQRDDSDGWTDPFLCVHNTEMSELASYGLYAEDRNAPANMTTVVMLGVKDVDVGNAPSGGTGTIDGNANSQGPLRTWGRGLTIIDGCDFFGRYGWSGAGSWADGATVTAAQPLRVFSTGTFDGTGRAFLTRISFEGDTILSLGSAVATQPPTGNAVLDGFLHVCTAASKSSMSTQMGGMTVRNGLAIKPDPVASDVKPYLRFLATEMNKAEGTFIPDNALDAPIRVHNCTAVVLNDSPDTDVEILSNGASFTDVTAENNLVYAPDYPSQTDHLDFAPFDSTELFAVRWLGRMEVQDNGVLDTDYAAPAGSVSLYQPEAGSPALDAATGTRVALYDLLGSPRPGDGAAIGALELAAVGGAAVVDVAVAMSGSFQLSVTAETFTGSSEGCVLTGRLERMNFTVVVGATITFLPLAIDGLEPGETQTFVPIAVSTKTDSDGRFSLRLRPGQYRVSVAVSASTYSEDITVPDQTTTELRILT